MGVAGREEVSGSNHGGQADLWAQPRADLPRVGQARPCFLSVVGKELLQHWKASTPRSSSLSLPSGGRMRATFYWGGEA